jgi:hypothetical protein
VHATDNCDLSILQVLTTFYFWFNIFGILIYIAGVKSNPLVKFMSMKEVMDFRNDFENCGGKSLRRIK